MSIKFCTARRIATACPGATLSMRFRKLGPCGNRPARAPISTALVFTAAILVASGCTVNGSPASAPHSGNEDARPTIRQTDTRGIKLPFTTSFPDRWSANNDGTTYEPCTALTGAELRGAGIDPTTVKDIAVANHQTARGCMWDYIGDHTAGKVAHATGNLPTFEESQTDREWYEVSYDLKIKGRLVLVNSKAATLCMTTVKSGRSPVDITVSKIFDPIGREAVCKRAIDFTRLVINRMPPAQ